MAASSSTATATSFLLNNYLTTLPVDYKEDKGNAKMLTEEGLLQLFSYFGHKELATLRAVCRLWRRIGSDVTLRIPFKEFLKSEFPKLPVTVLDESDWKSHVDLEKFGLSVDDAPVLDFNVVKELKRLSALPIEKGAGGTLLLKPKGISFNKVIEIAAVKSKQGPEFKFREIAEAIKVQFGKITTTKSCWVWFANDIIEESRSKTPEEQNQILAKIGCTMPDLVGCTMLAVLKFMVSEGRERLFDWDGQTYYNPKIPNDKALSLTRCSNQVNGTWHVVVGSCTAAGLRIIYIHGYSFIPLGVSPSLQF